MAVRISRVRWVDERQVLGECRVDGPAFDERRHRARDVQQCEQLGLGEHLAQAFEGLLPTAHAGEPVVHQGDAQQAVFSSRAEAVRVDVPVMQNGVPMRGLSAADFEVRDNGVLQQATLLSADTLPLNVVMALDQSDSVTGSRLSDLQNAGRGLLDELTERDGAALLTFGFAVTVAQRLTQDRAAVRAALGLKLASSRTLASLTFLPSQFRRTDSRTRRMETGRRDMGPMPAFSRVGRL